MVESTKWTRREFLERGGAAAGAVVLTSCGAEDPPPPAANTDATADTGGATDSAAGADGGGGDPGPAPVPDEGQPPRRSGPVVATVHRDSVDEAVRRAVELAGGLDAIKPGQTVFLKPNAVHGFAFTGAVVTANDLLASVIGLVKEREPGKIIVGDRSARFFTSQSVFDQTRMESEALKAGADEVYAAPKPADAPDDWVLMKPTGWEETWGDAGGVLVMKKLLAADHVINLPVCKNHRWAVFSLAMKNFIGGIGDESRDPMHYKEGDPDGLSKDIAVLNGAFDPLMTILDARFALVNGGPEGIQDDAVLTEPGLIMASKDRVAMDALGAALLQLWLGRVGVPKPDAGHPFLSGTDAWDMPQIKHGIALGLGATGPDEVELAFDDVDDAVLLEALFRTGRRG